MDNNEEKERLEEMVESLTRQAERPLAKTSETISDLIRFVQNASDPLIDREGRHNPFEEKTKCDVL